MSKQLMTIPLIAERLGVSVSRAYELARLGVIPTVRLGRQLRVDPTQFEEFIRVGGKPAAQEGGDR